MAATAGHVPIGWQDAQEVVLRDPPRRRRFERIKNKIVSLDKRNVLVEVPDGIGADHNPTGKTLQPVHSFWIGLSPSLTI